MEKRVPKLSILFFLILAMLNPGYLLPSDCTHTMRVGYWFEPCHTYDWQCEFCGSCLVTCTYYAVPIVCHEQQGNEYWLSLAHDSLCLPYPYPI